MVRGVGRERPLCRICAARAENACTQPPHSDPARVVGFDAAVRGCRRMSPAWECRRWAFYLGSTGRVRRPRVPSRCRQRGNRVSDERRGLSLQGFGPSQRSRSRAARDSALPSSTRGGQSRKRAVIRLVEPTARGNTHAMSAHGNHGYPGIPQTTPRDPSLRAESGWGNGLPFGGTRQDAWLFCSLRPGGPKGSGQGAIRSSSARDGAPNQAGAGHGP